MPEVAFEAGAAVGAHRVEVFAEVFAQFRLGGRTVGGDAAGVDDEFGIAESDLAEELGQHREAFGVEQGGAATDVFDADLVELAAASGGGAFPAEHRTHVVDPLFDAVHHVGVGEGAHHAGGAFGAEGQTAAAAVVEGIHLLLDDIRLVAEVSDEDIGAFEDGGPQFGVAVAPENLACGVFDFAPGGHFWFPEVGGARQRLSVGGHVVCPLFGKSVFVW